MQATKMVSAENILSMVPVFYSAARVVFEKIIHKTVGEWFSRIISGKNRTNLFGNEHPNHMLKYNLLAFKFLRSRMPFVFADSKRLYLCLKIISKPHSEIYQKISFIRL